MSRTVVYRKQLLKAIEAYLENTDSSRVRAQRIIDRCYTAINSEAKIDTIDWVVWGDYVSALTDSVYYEDGTYLRETREILLGQASESLARRVISYDYRPSFTTDEIEWYAHLLNIVEFIETIPYRKIHEATYTAWQQETSWTTTSESLPEVAQAKKIDDEYDRRKVLIENIATRILLSEHIGDEKIYRLLLREVTSLLTGLRVGMSAVVYGYPIPSPPYSGLHASGSQFNVTASIAWAKRVLEALAGNEGVFISCRLGKASTFDADVLVLSLS